MHRGKVEQGGKKACWKQLGGEDAGKLNTDVAFWFSSRLVLSNYACFDSQHLYQVCVKKKKKKKEKQDARLDKGFVLTHKIL